MKLSIRAVLAERPDGHWRKQRTHSCTQLHFTADTKSALKDKGYFYRSDRHFWRNMLAILATLEAEAGGLQVQGQPGIWS
jgi:hypothetical protein